MTTSDTLHLARIFPEEIWHLILANVDKASDYRKACEASPFFQALLPAHRTNALLSDVVKVLLKHRESREWEYTLEDDNDPRLHLRDFASLRQVCRSWRNGVNYALQNLPYQYQFYNQLNKLEYQFFNQIFNKYAENFQRVGDFQTFENYFDFTHLPNETNPFATRRVAIILPSEEDKLSLFLQAFIRFLDKYGKHVWYLRLRGEVMESSDRVHLFAQLKEMFVRLPNLKVLRISIFNLGCAMGAPISVIPKLKYLRFIELDQATMPLNQFVQVFQQSLSSLTQLGTVPLTKNDFLALCECEQNFSLTNLELDLHFLSMPWAEIFISLEKTIAKNLTHLRIWLPDGYFGREDHLRLPNLKVLQLCLKSEVSLDFLLPMASHLQELLIRLSNRDVSRSEEREIRFFEHFHRGRLQDSNIWDKFPKLKNITTWHIYRTKPPGPACTREQWKSQKWKKARDSV